jgi:hypothetical protein
MLHINHSNYKQHIKPQNVTHDTRHIYMYYFFTHTFISWDRLQLPKQSLIFCNVCNNLTRTQFIKYNKSIHIYEIFIIYSFREQNCRYHKPKISHYKRRMNVNINVNTHERRTFCIASTNTRSIINISSFAQHCISQFYLQHTKNNCHQNQVYIEETLGNCSENLDKPPWHRSQKISTDSWS